MTTSRARIENDTRAFERLLDATVAQTRVMTEMVEVQRANKDATTNSGDAVIALGGLIEKQTIVLEAMKGELAAGPERTKEAVSELKEHIVQVGKESDQRLYRWLLLGGIAVFLGTSLGSGAFAVFQVWMKIPR